MLDVRIHDKHQIEFKTHYHFKQQEEHTAYAFEIYMFIPNDLDIDHSNVNIRSAHLDRMKSTGHTRNNRV